VAAQNQKERTTIPPLKSSGGCPFFQRSTQSCLAARNTLPLEPLFRSSHCFSDDYDNCPLFLCQALRSSSPQGVDRESIIFSGK